MLAYLRLLVSDDPIALARVINVPPRKIGKATWQSLEHTANASGVSVWQALELTAAPPPPPPRRAPAARPGGGDAEAKEGGDGEASQEASHAARLEADNEGGGIKPPGPAARRALATFHDLVAGFRAEVRQATVEEEAADAAAAASVAAAEVAAAAVAVVLLQTFPRAPKGYRCTEVTTHDSRLTTHLIDRKVERLLELLVLRGPVAPEQCVAPCPRA